MIKGKLTGTEESVEIYDVITGLTVAILKRIFSDSCEEEYHLIPDYNSPLFENEVDIPGYDLNLRLPEYVREGHTVFMTEYLPPKSREDSYELMLSFGLDIPYDMWAFMIECGRKCQDNWRVRRIPGQVYEHDKYRIKK